VKASRVTANLLTPRLDAEYYAPDVISLVKRLKVEGHPVLGALLKHMKRHPMCYGFDQAEEMGSNRIPYFKGEDLYDLTVVHGGSFIDDVHFDSYPSAQVRHGELIMSVRGTIGRASVCRTERGLCSPNTIVLVPRSETDPEFIAAFFASSYGKTLINREISGTVQDTITEEGIRNIQAVSFHHQAQTFIGEKVRQAEGLRAEAVAAEQGFVRAIQGDCPEVFGEPKALGRSSWVSGNTLGRNLNPGAFNPERLRIRSEIERIGGRLLGEVAMIEAKVTTAFGPNADYIGLESVSSSNLQLSPVKAGEAGVSGTARVLCEGPVISKLRPYLNKVAYIPHELGQAVGSTELLCVRPKEGVDGWYICGVLKLPCTLRQFQPLANGSTHPRIEAVDVLDVMIPWREDAAQLGASLKLAQAKYFASNRLTTAAKLLIEALIEGHVTESDLIAAQEALDRGDTGLDRALLSRLTRKGIDAPGEPPLFPDLDALYGLLQPQEEATV